MQPPPAYPPVEDPSQSPGDREVYALERPDPILLQYYAVHSLFYGPFFPIVFFFRFLRYRTLRYRFDDEGISMRWGALWKKEINLTYQRIQDIHVTSGVVQRWFGLATIEIQTASGSHKPEMKIEGFPGFATVRRFLERRMRRMRHRSEAAAGGAPAMGGNPDRLQQALRSVVDALRETRRSLDEVFETSLVEEDE